MNRAHILTDLPLIIKVMQCIMFLVGWIFLTLPVRAQFAESTAYTFSTLAGKPSSGSTDGVGNLAQFSNPSSVAADSAGNIFVADSYNHTIRMVTPAGVVRTIAGFPGTSGSADGKNGTARFNYPRGVAVDSDGNVYVSDANSTIRRISHAANDWIVTTIVGSAAHQGNKDGTNTDSWFTFPTGLAVDSIGNIYVADSVNDTIRKITQTGTNWVVTTIAGFPNSAGSVDGIGSAARFSYPAYLAVDNASTIFVTDLANDTIRKINQIGTNWVVSTVAGAVTNAGSADGLGSDARFYHPTGVAVDPAGNVYVGDFLNNTIRKITSVGTNYLVSTLAGNASFTVLSQVGSSVPSYADGTGTNALFANPSGLAVDNAGNVCVADSGNDTIRIISPAGVVNTIAGSADSRGSANGAGNTARFFAVEGGVLDNVGNVYVTDADNNTIRKVTPAGMVSTVAGTPGTFGYADGIGSSAKFSNPVGIAIDGGGNLYVADSFNDVIRIITPAGVASTLVGSVTNAGSADGTGTNAQFNVPLGIALGNGGSLFVADSRNNTIRKISPAGTNWQVSTIAGLAGVAGSADGIGSNGKFNHPDSLAVDSSGNIFVADSHNHTIRKATLVGADWVVSTVAGLANSPGTTDGVGNNARFDNPDGIAVDRLGNLYVSDAFNQLIRRVTPVGTNWIVTTIGGQVNKWGSTDGTGDVALFNDPFGIMVDLAGNIYICDGDNNTIRKGVFTAYGPTNVVAFSLPAMNGQLVVMLLPPEANGQWRFPWEARWHNSGDVVSNLVSGNYPISFRSLSGYLTLSNDFEVAVAGGTTTYVTNVYYPSLSVVGTTNAGSLTVNIQPNAPSGSGWRFLGETGWRAPGSTASNLPPDVYFIEFEPVSGYSKPASQAIQVYPTLPTVYTANYLLAQSPPGGVLLPAPVPAANINDMADYPFGFNGQLQTDVGYGSGVAVQQNVVLTAAHLVFNDQTLSYVSQAYWYFQQEKGVFQPEPLQARGWYVLSGYASQRTNDLLSGFYTPGQSSPQSRNFDVAALYFLSPVAGGGYGGYLPSDASPNTWLTSTSLKILVGYPVDGSLFGDASIVPGTMCQTDPQPYPLTLATDPVDDQQVYLATWLLSYPGNSGGPLYVQYNGYYYPAGVYLGTLFSGTVPYASLVRAIDSNVVDMITLAASLGDSGTNGTGGGVITIIPNQAITANNPGYIQWQLGPSAAALAGAGWRLQGNPTYSTASNYTEAVNTTNVIVVEFKPIPGWNLPTNQTVIVLPGQFTTYSAFYTVTNPVLVANAILGIGITGTTGTVYQIQRRSSLASGTWIPVSTNTILSNGFNLILPPPALPNQSSAFYRAVWLP